MATLKVRAHWSSTLTPVPQPITSYGTPPVMSPHPPGWPSPPLGPVLVNAIYHVWCPLVPQSVLDDPATKWGANTVHPTPPSWPTSSGASANTYDQGYSAGAADFKVSGLRLWQDGPPGTDFTYTVTAPNGTSVTITPTAPGWTNVPLPVPINSGKGIWLIDIDRASGSSVGAPALLKGTPAANGGVDEPYVSPYGNMYEGILGLEFTGEEVVTPNCYDIKVSHPGHPCLRAGQPSVAVTFTATITPATPPFTGTVIWQVRDGQGSLLPLPMPTPTGTTLTFTFTQKGQYQVTAMIVQPGTGCTYMYPSDTDTVDIVDCTCPSIIGSTNGIQVTQISGCTFSFSIQITNPSATTPTFTWDFGDGTGPHVLNATPTYTYPAQTIGTRTVTVTLTNNDPSCSDMATTKVNVKCGTTTPTPTTPTPTPTPTTPTPTTPTPTPTPTTPTSTGSGFSLCCFLIWWWGISHWVTGTLLYFSLWWAALICGIIATIILIVWIAVCCWPCALKPWKCCTLLRWLVMFNDVLVITLFALYALGVAGNGYVVAGFGATSTVLRIIMAASNCGAIPNIFDPTTWPSCKCP
jgi:PKD domain